MSTRSNRSVAPTLPITTADITCVPIPSRPSIRERARAVWQSFVIAFVCFFVGGASRTPVGDVEYGRAFPADASFDHASAPIMPIPSSQINNTIAIPTPVSRDVQSENNVEATIDASNQPICSDPNGPSRASPELGYDTNEVFIPSLALTIDSTEVRTSATQLAPEGVSSTPETLVPSSPVPRLAITPPTTPNHLPAHRQKNRIALRRPLRKRMDQRYLTVPLFRGRSRAKTPAAPKATIAPVKPRPRSVYLNHLKSKATWGGGEMGASSSAPIPEPHVRQSSPDHYHIVNAAPINTGVVGIFLAHNAADISTLRSTFYSHTEPSFLHHSTSTSITSLACTKAEQPAMTTSALPSADTSSTLADLGDPFRYDSIIDMGTVPSAGPPCTAEPKPHVSAFSSPVAADCHDPIRHDPRLGEGNDKETLCIGAIDDRQGKWLICITSMFMTSAETRRKINSADRCAWWLSTKPASDAKQSTAEISSLPVSDTSSTMADILDPFRYDSYLDHTETPVSSKKQAHPPKDSKPEPGMSTYNSASTVASIYDLFQYDREDGKEDHTYAMCQDYRVNGGHCQVKQYHQLEGLPSSHTISTISEIVGMFQYDCDEEAEIKGKSKDKGSEVDDADVSQSFHQEVERRRDINSECRRRVASSWLTISSDLFQVEKGNGYDDFENRLVTDTTAEKDQGLLPTATLFASLQLRLPEAADSQGPSLKSGIESVAPPSADSRVSNLIAVAPLTSDFYSTPEQLSSSASFPVTLLNSQKDRRGFSLPQLRIPIVDESRKPDRGHESQKNPLYQESDAPTLVPLSPPLTPAARKQPRGILKKDRTKGENTPCDASASISTKCPPSKLPTRLPLAPILPNQEERRSTGPTASSRLKSRQRETYFVLSAEPPPMPTLPVGLHSTSREPARRDWSMSRAALPLTPPSLPQSEFYSTTEPFGPSKGVREPNLNVAPTVTDPRGSVVPHGDPASPSRSTATFESTSIGLPATRSRTQLSATPRLWLSSISEVGGQPSVSSRERVATTPGLDTISESASLDSTLSSASLWDTTMPGCLDTPPSWTNIHRMERETRGHILDEFPIPQHTNLCATRMSPSSSRLNGSGSRGVTQPVSADRQPMAPRVFVGIKVPAQPLGIVKSPTLGETLRNAYTQCGLHSGLTGLERRLSRDQPSAGAHLVSARAAIQAISKSNHTTPVARQAVTKLFNTPASGRARGAPRSPMNSQVSYKF